MTRTAHLRFHGWPRNHHATSVGRAHFRCLAEPRAGHRSYAYDAIRAIASPIKRPGEPDKAAPDKPADKAAPDKPTDNAVADKAAADKAAADKAAAAKAEPPSGFESPTGKKPARGTDAGNVWRYQRYKYKWWKNNRNKPEAERARLKTEAEYGEANFKGGRAGGENQQATRARLASEEGYINTETTQLGDRIVDGATRKNMVDMHKPGGADGGGTRYVEVDPMNNSGFPDPPMIDKLKAEIDALKPGDDLMFVDSNNFNRRTVFKYGDDPGVVDTTPGPKAPRRPPRKPTK